MRVICGFIGMPLAVWKPRLSHINSLRLFRRIKKKLALFNIASYMNHSFGDTVAVRVRVNR